MVVGETHHFRKQPHGRGFKHLGKCSPRTLGKIPGILDSLRFAGKAKALPWGCFFSNFQVAWFFNHEPMEKKGPGCFPGICWG